MKKLIFLFLIFFVSNLYLEAQINDTANSSQVFIIGIIELNDPVLINPKYKQRTERKLPIELSSVVMEKKKMGSFITTKKKDFKYISLDSNCYILVLSGLGYFVHENIIPIASEKYLSILNKAFPSSIRGIDMSMRSMYGDKQKWNKEYTYCDILHHRFLVVLISASLHNHFYTKVAPRMHRFQGNKAEQGIYLKLLIPILDDFE